MRHYFPPFWGGGGHSGMRGKWSKPISEGGALLRDKLVPDPAVACGVKDQIKPVLAEYAAASRFGAGLDHPDVPVALGLELCVELARSLQRRSNSALHVEQRGGTRTACRKTICWTAFG